MLGSYALGLDQFFIQVVNRTNYRPSKLIISVKLFSDGNFIAGSSVNVGLNGKNDPSADV
jgi:hypothetical protein